jgi:hypothetical protein
MTIIPFQQRPHVVIDGGTIQSQTITDHEGTRAVFTDVGSFRFFVDVVEADGTRIGMWDGKSYEEAIIQANILSADFGPVQDRVGGGS